MPRVRSFIVATAFAAMALGPAQAQIPGGHHPARGGTSGPQQVNCDMVAANPDAGMDKASCEAMNQAAASYYNSQHDPSASRPGDESMTCADIKAEFMQQPMVPPSHEHVAAAQAATADVSAETAKLQAQAAAQSAALSAQSMAASALSVANPLSGRAADQAVNSEQQAMQAHAEALPLERKSNAATAAVVGDVTTQLNDNPRTARLVALASEKHCRGW
jgi:hypothetical protein